jgi:hypothetical protein
MGSFFEQWRKDRQPGRTRLCLSQLNPAYLPLYAEILKLKQRPLDAIDAYNRHVQTLPADVFVQLRLVRLFFDIKVPDSCQMLLFHMFERWPENRTARELQPRPASNSAAT